MGLSLVDVLFELWFTRSLLTEGRRWLERVLAIGDGTPSPTRARALNHRHIFNNGQRRQ